MLPWADDAEDIELEEELYPDGIDGLIAGAFAEVVENCGADCTSANPDLATWRFRLWRFSREPRAIPKPAEPALTTMRGDRKAGTMPALPTTTVLVVPVEGATRGWKLTGNVPA